MGMNQNHQKKLEGRDFLKRLSYLFRTFLLIGATSFGGYMSLIAMMRDRMVARDKTMGDDEITEGISLASMLPGPVAVNVVAYAGFHLAGVAGALVSICAVLLPSFILIVLLSVLYLTYSATFDFGGILRGIFPVVAAIIVATGVGMGKRACKRVIHYVIALLCFSVLFFIKGYWTIVLLLIAAAIAGIVLLPEQESGPTIVKRSWKPVLVSLALYLVGITLCIALTYQTAVGKLIAEFTQVSLTLFGGGYVMVPILKTRFVDQLAWFTQQEFIYGISIGQITPGPILTSAGFFGYKIAGLPGALAATLAIYLPSSMLMIVCANIIAPLRGHRIFQAALAGLKPAIVGIILYSGVMILVEGMDANWIVTAVIAAAAFWLSYRYNVIALALIAAGGLTGFFIYQ
jgi:chromate transporter